MSAPATANDDNAQDNTQDNSKLIIDALINARLELHTAEDAVRDNDLAITAAQTALSQARSNAGKIEFNAFLKRKAVEAAEARFHASFYFFTTNDNTNTNDKNKKIKKDHHHHDHAP